MDREKTRPEKSPEGRRGVDREARSGSRSASGPGGNAGSRTEIDDRVLLRLLQGELPPEEAAELRHRLKADRAAAARLQELERLWNGLELPPPDAAPPGFAARVAARAAEGSRGTWAGADAPFGSAWARAAAGAALGVGLVLGAGAGWFAGERAPAAEISAEAGGSALEGELEADEWAYLEEDPPTLAESYWDAFYEASEEEER